MAADTPLVDSIFANPVIIHIVLGEQHYRFPRPFSSFIVMMNQAVREEKNIARLHFDFAAELVQNNVPSGIIPTGKNSTVAISRFFDITMHVCFVRVVTAVVNSTCRPGSTWPPCIIRKWILLELFEYPRRQSAQYRRHFTEDWLTQVEELIHRLLMLPVFRSQSWFWHIGTPKPAMDGLVVGTSFYPFVVVGFCCRESVNKGRDLRR